MARRKYRADSEWLKSHAGFTIDEACLVARTLGELQMQKLVGLREMMLELHPDQWTFLPGFTFSVQELEAQTNIIREKIERILDAFSVDQDKANASFSSLSAFNDENAGAIIHH